jgi:hypothetical protein
VDDPDAVILVSEYTVVGINPEGTMEADR